MKIAQRLLKPSSIAVLLGWSAFLGENLKENPSIALPLKVITRVLT